MPRVSLFLLITSTIFCGIFSKLQAQDSWYVLYEEALNAISQENWARATDLLNNAIAAKAEPKRNARTYGMNFIDYLPYLYRGMAYYHSGDFERARADFRRSQDAGEAANASRDKSAAQNLQMYLNLLAQHDERQKREKVFNEGMSFFNSGNLDAAKQKFQQVITAEPDHAEAARYLKRIEDKEKTALPESDLSGSAGPRNTQPPPANTSHRNDIRKSEAASPAKGPDRSGKIEELRQNGIAAFESGDLTLARQTFSNLLNLDKTNSDANNFLNRIERVEEGLQRGLEAYFQGETAQAVTAFEQLTSEYSGSAHAFFFLGAARLSQYFLSGGSEAALLEKAKSAFAAVKRIRSDYQPNTIYISPKIIAVFSQMN